MLGIDPAIVVHEINTYPGDKPVRQRLRRVHPHVKRQLSSLRLKNISKSILFIPWL
jgi:hypothetical protein